MNPLWVSTGFLALGTDIKPTELTSTEKHTMCHTALAIHVTSYNHAHISSYKAIPNVTIIMPCIMWMCSFWSFKIAQALTGTPPLHLAISCTLDHHRGAPFYKKSLLTRGEGDFIIILILLEAFCSIYWFIKYRVEGKADQKKKKKSLPSLALG